MLENKKDASKLIDILCKKNVRWLRDNILNISDKLEVNTLIDPDKRNIYIEEIVGKMSASEINDLLNHDSIKFELNYDVEKKALDKKIFIVHGNSQAAENAITNVELFCKNQNLEYIILKREVNKGRTIIEKLIELADSACYAIILYTNCDKGRKHDEDDDKLKYRARQNVVFEHGFFTAKLGRGNVCVLRESEIEDTVIEQPSDNSGVVYIEMDTAGLWKKNLAEELEAAKILSKINYKVL